MSRNRKKFERLLLSSVSNLAMSFADAYIEKNVERRASAGLKVTVIRRQVGNCCKWCRNLAGIYTADQLPDDIYKRHANCRCMVTYKTEKVYTDAWSKKQFETQKAARLEREKELKQADYIERVFERERRIAKDQKQRYYDATEKWFYKAKIAKDKPKVIDEKFVVFDEKMNKIGGDNIALNYTKHEKEVAEMLMEKLGGTISMQPKVNYPLGIRKSDYIYNGLSFDLKEIKKAGKNTVYNRLHSEKKQADNFVIDISNGELSVEEAVNQIKKIFTGNHTRFVNSIILIKNMQVLKIFERI